MNAKHRKMLAALFVRPTPADLAFADIGSRCYLHRPHPGKEARRYQVEELALWFAELGVMP